MIKALILAGGHGTRMHPLTLRTPKALLPIAGKPNILHLIDSLINYGIKDIYVSINESQLKINHFLKDKKVNLIIENQDKGKLGTIGGLNYAINKIGVDDLLVIGADNFFKGLNFKELIDSMNKSATLVLYNLPNKLLVEHYGIAVVNNGVIKSFQEKPSVNEAKSTLASTLAYAISKEWIKESLPEYINNNHNLDTIGSMWQYFCKKQSLNGFIFNGLWADIGTPRAYVELNKKVLDKKIISDKAIIDESVVIEGNVIIEDGCIIGKNCVIKNGSHIMHHSIINDGSIINGSIIFENTRIGRNTIINNSVIDGFSVIGDNVVINDFSVIGFNAVISSNSRLLRESKVWPFLKANGVIDGDIVYLKNDDELMRSKYWVI